MMNKKITILLFSFLSLLERENNPNRTNYESEIEQMDIFFLPSSYHLHLKCHLVYPTIWQRTGREWRIQKKNTDENTEK